SKLVGRDVIVWSLAIVFGAEAATKAQNEIPIALETKGYPRRVDAMNTVVPEGPIAKRPEPVPVIVKLAPGYFCLVCRPTPEIVVYRLGNLVFSGERKLWTVFIGDAVNHTDFTQLST